MTFSPDSPELTAYLLGELDPETRAALEAELQHTPAELNSLSQVLGEVSEAFAAEPAVGLSPDQHRRVMAALAPPTTEAVALPSRSSGEPRTLWAAWTAWLGWRGGFVLAGGLAAVALGVFLIAPKREGIRSLAGAEGLRYQPDWKPAAVAVEEGAATVASEAPVFPPAAPEATPLAMAPASVPAPATKSLTPALAKRYGLQPAPEPIPAGAESRGKSEAHWQYEVGDASASQMTRTLSAASASSTLARDTQVLPPLSDRSRGGMTASSSAVAGRALVERETLARSAHPGSTPVHLASRRIATATASASASPTKGLSEKDPAGAGIQSFGGGMNPDAGRHDFYETLSPANSGLADSFAEPAGARGADATARFGLRVAPPATPGLRVVEANGPSTAFAPIQDNPFQTVTSAPLSTFGMDVDTGSYSLIRRMLRENSLPPGDAVRLEELLNYFSYDYPQPKGDHPLGATVEVAACPWNEAHKLVRIGVKAREVANEERPRSNLVFLLDVSGSMAPETRLPLVKRAMRLLIDRLSPRDTVGIVTYAGEARVALEPVAISDEGRRQVTEVLDSLQAGSGTHGSAGIQNAYAMATNHFIPGGVNRVILCTDGDFNVGITDQNELLSLITARAKSGVFLSVLGFGMDNLKDSTLELLADRGNGNYAYIDSFSEARKVLVKQLDGTLVTVAKDAKIQVEFNPARVSRYRLLGYEKRLLRDRDFNDDTKDAGEVGAGHSVTVLYEIEPVGGTGSGVDPLRYAAAPAAAPESRFRAVHSEELLNLKIRYKQPEGQTSRLMEMPVKDMDRDLAKASVDFKFATSVAGYGMLLRQSPHAGTLTWEQVLRLAEQGQGNDPDGYRAEFIDLARRAQALHGKP